MMREFEITGYNDGDIPFHVGQISYIQEPGFKLRAVANPARVYQYLLAPLGDLLFNMLRYVEEDFTFRQDESEPVVRSFLDGSRVYSVDISDATNNFPLAYTEKIFSQFIPEGKLSTLAKIFCAISRAPWLTPEGDLIRWTVGQPLGLYPSFAAFALSHHCLLQSLKATYGGQYVVLGDDVVIKGDALYSAYRHALDAVGIPVSESKTFISRHLAEFAGRTITKDFSYIGHRYSRITDDSFFDLTKELGPKFVRTLPKKLRRVVEALAPLPEPVGFGWNPEGKSLVDRCPGEILEVYLRGSPLPKSDDSCKVNSFLLKQLMSPVVSYSRRIQSLDHIRKLSGTEVYSVMAGLGENPISAVPLPDDTLLQTLIDLKRAGIPIARNLREVEYRLRRCYREPNGTLVFLDGDLDSLIRSLHVEIRDGEPKETFFTRREIAMQVVKELDQFNSERR